MKQLSKRALLPLLAGLLVFCGTATASAQSFWWGGYWGGYRPTYSSYYAPAYSSYYAPSSYTASYWPSTSYYSASYWPTTSYYAPSVSNCPSCCSSGSCGYQASYSIAPSCGSSCAPSCSTCGDCGTCSNCTLAAAGDQNNLDNQNNRNLEPTTVQPRANTVPSRNPTFIEEEDRAPATNYDNGTGDGFAPRRSNDPPMPESNTPVDPLDQTFGSASAGGRDTLRFKIPSPVLQRREPAPAHTTTPVENPAQRVKSNDAADYPLLRLDEKITTRSVPERTRLIERRSWEQPLLANNISRQTRVSNLDWVPVPTPTQLVRK